MDILLHIVHALSALVLIVLIMLQQGKGADAGAAFGSGASGTMFGSAGSANFMTRSTAILATIFMVTSLALAWQARRAVSDNGMAVPALNQVIQEQHNSQSAPVPSSVPTLDNGKAPAASNSEVPSLGAPAQSAGDVVPSKTGGKP